MRRPELLAHEMDNAIKTHRDLIARLKAQHRARTRYEHRLVQLVNLRLRLEVGQKRGTA